MIHVERPKVFFQGCLGLVGTDLTLMGGRGNCMPLCVVRMSGLQGTGTFMHTAKLPPLWLYQLCEDTCFPKHTSNMIFFPQLRVEKWLLICILLVRLKFIFSYVHKTFGFFSSLNCFCHILCPFFFFKVGPIFLTEL